MLGPRWKRYFMFLCSPPALALQKHDIEYFLHHFPWWLRGVICRALAFCSIFKAHHAEERNELMMASKLLIKQVDRKKKLPVNGCRRWRWKARAGKGDPSFIITSLSSLIDCIIRARPSLLQSMPQLFCHIKSNYQISQPRFSNYSAPAALCWLFKFTPVFRARMGKFYRWQSVAICGATEWIWNRFNNGR